MGLLKQYLTHNSMGTRVEFTIDALCLNYNYSEVQTMYTLKITLNNGFHFMLSLLFLLQKLLTQRLGLFCCCLSGSILNFAKEKTVYLNTENDWNLLLFHLCYAELAQKTLSNYRLINPFHVTDLF